jgi:sulfate transport system permease protein
VTNTVALQPADSLPPVRSRARRERRFGATLLSGYVLTYLGLIVVLPLAALLARVTSVGVGEVWRLATEPRALASLRLSYGTAAVAALVNTAAGFVVAWTLTRYRFPGRRIVDALIDLPFALPTAVGGIALTAIFAETGWLGAPLAKLGIAVAFTPIGITVALVFVTLPFVVRTLQPVIAELDPAVLEAARCLGATPAQTFRKIIIPELMTAIVTGFTLAFARGVGEYGSVVFIAGNMPMKTEVTSLLIITKLEQYDYAGATALATVMLATSFVFLLVLNGLQWLGRSRQEAR